MIIIAWQYLLGRCVATDFTDREQPEWPPHPDRVFQALVAAWAELGKPDDGRAALEWLESLPTPSIAAPDPESIPLVPKVYVPVNDIEASKGQRQKAEYGKGLEGLLPDFRPKKERYFPFVRIGDSICALQWDAEASVHRHSLERLCAAVTRIGHSSSIVRCWLADVAPPVDYSPDPSTGDSIVMLRIPETGRLSVLSRSYDWGLESGTYMAPPAARQKAYAHRLDRPVLGHGQFRKDLMIFRQTGGRRFDLRQSLDLTEAFRGMLLAGAENLGGNSSRAKSMISGHAPDGSPLQGGHLAYLPLGFVGDIHADGHILGIALATPGEWGADAEDLVVASLAYAFHDDGTICLRLGSKGEMILQYETSSLVPKALRPETWCRPSLTWASVTPIVMDHMMKKRQADLEKWAAERIAVTCGHQGIPEPIRVSVSPVPFLEGSSPCYNSERTRGQNFPPIRRKDGQANWLFHARIEFSVPVRGPLVLGSGRYRGYGLCKPLEGLC